MIFIMHTKRILVCAVLVFILYLVIRWLDGKPLLEGYGGGHGFGKFGILLGAKGREGDRPRRFVHGRDRGRR